MTSCNGVRIDIAPDWTGQLTIDTTLMHGPAWKLLDLRPLWLPAKMRGSNQLVPGVPGTLAYRRRATETTVVVPGVMTGMVDRFDVPQADPWIGFEANLDYLEANVLGPVDGALGRVASLVKPSGAVRTGLVQELEMELGEFDLATARHWFTLSMTLPGGNLV